MHNSTAVRCLISGVVFMSFIALSSVALGGAGKCYKIKNKDKMNFCLFRETKNGLYCSKIRNSDINKHCWALERKSKGMCTMIKNKARRKLCLSEVERLRFENNVWNYSALPYAAIPRYLSVASRSFSRVRNSRGSTATSGAYSPDFPQSQ